MKKGTLCFAPSVMMFRKAFLHVPLAVRLILQLQCSPIGNKNFQNKTTEGTKHSVYEAGFGETVPQTLSNSGIHRAPTLTQTFSTFCSRASPLKDKKERDELSINKRHSLVLTKISVSLKIHSKSGHS